jgi:hypothetical protein
VQCVDKITDYVYRISLLTTEYSAIRVPLLSRMRIIMRSNKTCRSERRRRAHFYRYIILVIIYFFFDFTPPPSSRGRGILSVSRLEPRIISRSPRINPPSGRPAVRRSFYSDFDWLWLLTEEVNVATNAALDVSWICPVAYE